MKAAPLLRGLLLAVVAISLGVFAWQRLSARPAEAPAPAQESSGVQALYLHGTFRCETCNSIEEQARRAIQEDFAAEMAGGRLSWAEHNIDKDEFAHYGEAFALTSASLVLSDGRGAEGRWKNLERTWELVGDPAAFREYVSGETRAFLDAAR